MKTKKIFFLANVILLFALANAVKCYAQEDTIQYHYIIGTLGDSTRVQYEIGSFGVKHNGKIQQYLSFASNNQSIPTYFRTNKFVIQGTDNYLCFLSCINFDDKNYERPRTDIPDLNSIQFHNWVKKIAAKYQSHFVSPDSNYFASNSSILFIVELRRFSDDSVLARVDTSKCFLGGSKQIVYKNYPSSHSIRSRKITGVTSGDTVYLTVSIEKSLPTSGDFIGYEYEYIDANYPAGSGVGQGFFGSDDFTSPNEIIDSLGQ